jgi:hypothetical protein
LQDVVFFDHVGGSQARRLSIFGIALTNLLVLLQMFILVPVPFKVAAAKVLFLLFCPTIRLDRRLIKIGVITPRGVPGKVVSFEGSVERSTKVFTHAAKIGLNITFVGVETLLYEPHVVRKTALVGPSP